MLSQDIISHGNRVPWARNQDGAEEVAITLGVVKHTPLDIIDGDVLFSILVGVDVRKSDSRHIRLDLEECHFIRHMQSDALHITIKNVSLTSSLRSLSLPSLQKRSVEREKIFLMSR